MSKKVALLLLTLFAYTLVLVHGIMPHQHLHQTDNKAQHHTYKDHRHSHDHDAPEEKESPLSHYFHSAVQGEPHVSTRHSSFLPAPLTAARSERFLFELETPVAAMERGTTLYIIGFSPPPHQTHLPQRGPPSA
ncbi:hypothetical protein [Pontibacter saemangeumensis]|uniref:hypothetical protein n=1 Tax=Pontibacter saemangeumensis TaxID=1084525 RepID=UPI0031EFBCCB